MRRPAGTGRKRRRREESGRPLEEAGATWLRRLTDTYDHMVWINPTPKDYWEHSYSIEIVRELTKDRMFPLSVKGLEEAMALLAK